MKKLMLMLAVLFAPLLALAELPLVYPARTVLSVVPLTRTQQNLVEYLYEPVLSGQKKIELPSGTRYDDVGPAMQSLMMDYPELFHLHREYTITYYQNAPDKAVAVTPQYRMDAGEAKQVRQRMYDAARAMIRRDSTALGLHDALVDRVTYGGTTEMRHTAAAALLDGLATCEGYAQALSLLYRMAGYPCGVISGVAADSSTGRMENHAWNVAWLSGSTMIDATWNDQERAGWNTHWYYGLSTEQMAADHVPDKDLYVPDCGDQVNWHRYMGGYITTYEEALAAVGRLVRDGTPVNLRIADPWLYAQIVGDTGAFLDDYNRWCSPGSRFYGSYTYLTGEAQLCLILDRAD